MYIVYSLIIYLSYLNIERSCVHILSLMLGPNVAVGTTE